MHWYWKIQTMLPRRPFFPPVIPWILSDSGPYGLPCADFRFLYFVSSQGCTGTSVCLLSVVRRTYIQTFDIFTQKLGAIQNRDTEFFKFALIYCRRPQLTYYYLLWPSGPGRVSKNGRTINLCARHSMNESGFLSLKLLITQRMVYISLCPCDVKALKFSEHMLYLTCLYANPWLFYSVPED